MSNENTPDSAPIASALLSITEQVGEHVLRCLRDENVVAKYSLWLATNYKGKDA